MILRLYLVTEDFVNTLLCGQTWKIRAVIIATFSTFLLGINHPTIWDLFNEYYAAFNTNFYFWPTVEWQVNHPLEQIYCANGRPGCHEEKMLFRLFLPIMMGILKSRLAIYLVQLCCWPIFLYLLTREAYRITDDRLLALYTSLGIIGLYVGGSFVFDFIGCGDAFGYFFLMLALASRNPMWLFFSLSAGYWVDERVLISSALVGVYHVFVANRTLPLISKANQYTVEALVGSWFTYLSLRLGLGAYYHVATPTTTANFDLLLGVGFFGNILKLFRGFEFWWVLIGLGLVGLYKQRQYTFFIATSVSLITILVVSIMVGDTNRSIGNGFAIMLICLSVARKKLSRERLRKILFWIALLCLICPTRFMLTYGPPPIPFLQKL